MVVERTKWNGEWKFLAQGVASKTSNSWCLLLLMSTFPSLERGTCCGYYFPICSSLRHLEERLTDLWRFGWLAGKPKGSRLFMAVNPSQCGYLTPGVSRPPGQVLMRKLGRQMQLHPVGREKESKVPQEDGRELGYQQGHDTSQGAAEHSGSFKERQPLVHNGVTPVSNIPGWMGTFCKILLRNPGFSRVLLLSIGEYGFWVVWKDRKWGHF